MEKEKKLKNYNVVLEDWHEGVFATSLVGNPATESDYVFYGKEPSVMLFGDEEKREVVGAVMIPDKKIIRKCPDTGELFTVTFSKEVISQLNERMKEYGYDNSFTFHHSYSTQDNVQILESWIKEFDDDKSNGYGFDLPVGTLFFKVKIKEDNLWDMIKEHKLNGFSIELNAGYKLENEEDSMSKIEAFDHNKDVDNFSLVWDGDEAITVDTLLFTVVKETVDEKEMEKIEKFSGEFTLDEVEFNVDKGIVSIVEKVVEEPVVDDEPKTEVFNKDEMIEAINTAVASQFDTLKEMFGAQKEDSDKLADSLEEVKLFQKQNSVDEVKEVDNKEKDTVRESRNFSSANSWFNARTNKNNK